MDLRAMETGKETPTRIPLQKARAPFQTFLYQEMTNEKLIDKIDAKEKGEVWNEEDLAKIKKFTEYAKIVADIIDNPKNTEIRNLIMEGKYQEASNIVIRMLDKEKNKRAA